MFEIKYKIKLQRLNKNKEILEESEFEGKSFLVQYSKLVSGFFLRGDVTQSIGVFDTDGNVRTYKIPYSFSRYFWGAYTCSSGAKVELDIGTNSAPEDRTHKSLQTLLASIDYSTYSETDVSPNHYVAFTFAWENDTGNRQIIKEIGFCIFITTDGSSALRKIMLTRDLIPLTVDDAPAGTITVVNGNTTVEGVGTAFTNWKPGDEIQLPDNNWYFIDTITDDDTLDITIAYPGAGIGGQAFKMRTYKNVDAGEFLAVTYEFELPW